MTALLFLSEAGSSISPSSHRAQRTADCPMVAEPVAPSQYGIVVGESHHHRFSSKMLRAIIVKAAFSMHAIASIGCVGTPTTGWVATGATTTLGRFLSNDDDGRCRRSSAPQM